MTEATTIPVVTPVDRRADILSVISRFGLLLGFVALCAFFSARSDLFLTGGNIKNIGISSSILLIVAVPQAMLVIMGYVDLSVGSVLGICGVVTGQLIVVHHVAWQVAALVGLLAGAVVGILNGLLVTYAGLSPIIVTLGGLQLYRGLAQYLAPDLPTGFGNGMALLGRGVYLGIPVVILITVLVFLTGVIVVYAIPAGRHMFALGVNRDASYMSGIATRRLPILAFAATGFAAALGGVLLAARLDAAPPSTLGAGFELQVLTAVLLGGVAFSGGRGSMLGVVLGVFFLGVLSNGMTLLNVSSYGQSIASGVALILAAGLDELGTGTSLLRKLVRRRPPQGRSG